MISLRNIVLKYDNFKTKDIQFMRMNFVVGTFLLLRDVVALYPSIYFWSDSYHCLYTIQNNIIIDYTLFAILIINLILSMLQYIWGYKLITKVMKMIYQKENQKKKKKPKKKKKRINKVKIT